MKKALLIGLLNAAFFGVGKLLAQCGPGETEIQLILFTDDWGYEVYWEIVPSGNGCGNGTIGWGGNDIDVGCDGGGDQDAEGGNGYESNFQIVADPFCLTTGNAYDIHFVDDWGDGGLSMEMYQNGALSNLFVGEGDGDVWTFVAGEFPDLSPYDSPCSPLEIQIDAEPVAISNTDAIASFTEPHPDGGGCQTFGLWCEGTVQRTVWASFVASSDAVVVSTCNEGTDFDTQLALWIASDCINSDTYTLINANDDRFGGCEGANAYASALYASCLIPGETYLIQIDGYYGESGTSFLSVNTWDEGLSLEAFVDNVDCPNVKGDDSGAITLLAFGTGLDYTATWTGPNGYQGDGIYIDNLTVGDYSVELTTACGESASATFSVSIPDPLNVMLSIDPASCQTSPDGEVSLNVTGATEPYEFFWTGPGGYSATGSSQNDLSPGNYSVQITDDNGCEFTQIVNVDFEELFTFSLGEDTTICSNQEIVLFGPAGLNYEWQDGSNNQFYIVSGPNDGVDTYVVVLTGTNDAGCEHTDAIIVTVSSCVGIEENNSLAISAFPSPGRGELRLNGLPQGKLLVIDVFDNEGRLVFAETMSSPSESLLLNLKQLSSGLYTLRLNSDGNFGITRFVIE